jgi:two-component system nitrate/nitrite response regulator NarL
MIKVLVIDENPVLRLGVLALLADIPELELVGDPANGRSSLDMVREHRPDVILFGANAPDLERMRALVREGAGARIIVLTSTAEPTTLLRILTAGAHSCVVHGHFQPHELADVVVATARGESVLSRPVLSALVMWLHDGGVTGRLQPNPGLTPRQIEIMELISLGFDNRAIATRLGISEKTVKNHVHSIYGRLGADSRDHAIELWRILKSGGTAMDKMVNIGRVNLANTFREQRS